MPSSLHNTVYTLMCSVMCEVNWNEVKVIDFRQWTMSIGRGMSLVTTTNTHLEMEVVRAVCECINVPVILYLTLVKQVLYLATYWLP